MGLRHGGDARQLVLPVAAGARVVHRQHWPSPCPSRRSADPELPAEGGARSGAGVPRRSGADLLEEPAYGFAQVVGSEAAQTGRVRRR